MHNYFISVGAAVDTSHDICTVGFDVDAGGFGVSLLSGKVFVWHVGRFGGESFHWEHDLVLIVVSFRLVINTSGQGIRLG